MNEKEKEDITMTERMSQQDEGRHISGQANEPLSRPAHALSADQVALELEIDPTTGLGPDSASERLIKYGGNDLGKPKRVQPVKIFLAQIFNAMNLVLVLALAASLAIQSWIAGGVVGLIILINVFVGFFQDLKAQRTIASLDSLNSPTARVLRNGHIETVDATTIVPGDILELKVGDMVAADARLIECVNLEADEAALTGESLPVRKQPDTLAFGKHQSESGDSLDDIGPGDRLNIVFSSTVLTKGRGRAIVFATGMFTEIGAIAAALRNQGQGRKVKRDANGKASMGAYVRFGLGKTWDWVGAFLGLTVGTPLQRKISKLFFGILGAAVVCAIIVIAANDFSSRNDVIIYAITVAVSTLPITLVMVLTITMAAGTKVMVNRHVLVRNMRSLEALGGVTNICSDKTGTLTQGKMVTRMAWLPGHGTYTVGTSTNPHDPTAGDIEFTQSEPRTVNDDTKSTKVSPLEEGESLAAIKPFLNVANLANLANVVQGHTEEDSDDSDEEDPSDSTNASWRAHGDPTEVAIQVFAARFGRNKFTRPSFDDKEWKQLVEFPFESAVKKMSVLSQHRDTGEVCVFTKGAVERVIGSCITSGVDSVPMTEDLRATILSNMEAFARRGLRVLALASRTSPRSVTEDEAREGELKRDEFESDLHFHGLIGIYDPPRPESRPSVFKCHQAGIAVHMLTGDHPETARTIAREVGILPSRMELIRKDIADGMVMTATEFDRLSDAEVDKLPELPLVVARCAPSTKVRMIDALHRRGGYVAMTGDGVNDSPSLHRADVGIAMGQGGSDVAKSASDIVLSDDNFASILNAVEEGRRIFDNIQKFMLHVLAANVGFVVTLLIGLLYKDGTGISVFQLSPIEILFMLLVGGCFTETGLGFEAASKDILRRPPQSLKYGVFTPEFIVDLVCTGVIMTVVMISTFVVTLFGFEDGSLGEDCNITYTESCNAVFRSRSACFVVTMWVFLFFGWELIDTRRSFFDGIFSDTKVWSRRLWKNPFLFWSVVIGSLSVFPVLYIPVLNDTVFLHAPIDREWGVVIAFTLVYIAGIEAYKWGKRVYFRRNNLMLRGDGDLSEEDLEKRVFAYA